MQGISIGWSSVLSSGLAGQAIDVTCIPNGNYWLEQEVDPRHAIREGDETNNVAWIAITLTTLPSVAFIVGPPAHAASCVGGVALFVVSPVGTGPFTYQWQWQPAGAGGAWVNLVAGNNSEPGGVPMVSATNVAGATLVLQPLIGSLGFAPRAFRCMIANTCVNLPSGAALLYVDAADVGRQGGLAGRDSQHDNNDFVVFVNFFFTQDSRADLGMQGGVLGADSAFDNNDFVVFINQFFQGC